MHNEDSIMNNARIPPQVNGYVCYAEQSIDNLVWLFENVNTRYWCADNSDELIGKNSFQVPNSWCHDELWS